ncbi:lysophospholipid acyltransferase family protein [Pelagibacterium halotolerans]|uniref:lysophospholipid acyltransferase family protein n=1 Tax=Pelagibacterium halotolerans TaxID=531813 RepID=UPI003850649B
MILRLLFLALVVLPFTLVGLPIQALILAFNRPGWTILPRMFFKLMAFGLGLRVKIVGAPVKNGPVLLVANHISWLDIPAIASKFPVCFVAKSEIANWPVVGFMARLQKTVFVNRDRRTDAGRTASEMKDRIEEGSNVLLFAEGTSDIGTHVLPFRSALMGAARQAMAEGTGREVVVQPMTIAYTALSGLPLSRHERPKVAWIGDMGVGDNLKTILSSGPKDVTIAFGDPIRGDGDRKTIAKTAEREVRRMLVALNRGQPLQ